MREKYESLALVDLKEIAKARGMKGTSGMKKADIIEAMLLEDAKRRLNARSRLSTSPTEEEKRR